MKSLSLSRGVLSVWVAAVLLAGCSQTNGTLPLSNLGTPSLHLEQLTPVLGQSPAGGGGFSGSYSGTESLTLCSRFRTGDFKFSGSGKATFLRGSTESGEMYSFYNILQNRCSGWAGNATLVRKRKPSNAITVGLLLPPGLLCDENISWSVTSGTGKFAGATGSGTVTFHCAGSGYSDRWSGTLNF